MGRVQYPQYLLLARLILLAPLQVNAAAAVSEAGSAAAAGAPAAVQPAAGAAWLAASCRDASAGAGAAAAAAEGAGGPSLPGWCWWALRAVLLQQRLLSGRSASLRSLLLGLQHHVLAGFALPVEATLAQPGQHGGRPTAEEQLLAAGALLEAALLETAFGHVEATKAFLQRASEVLGFCSGAWQGRLQGSGARRARPGKSRHARGWRQLAGALKDKHAASWRGPSGAQRGWRGSCAAAETPLNRPGKAAPLTPPCCAFP